MTIITQGNSSTGTLNYLDSVTVEAGSGFASFESPSGTVLAQFSGARTFGPYSNRTYRVVAILGDIKYSINDDFPQGSVVQSVPVMGPSGTITGLRNPDGTVTNLSGGSTAFVALTDAATAPIATTNTSVANAIAAVVANDLTTSATVAPSKDAVNAALALKAAILGPIGLGAGAIALTAATHANHSTGWTGTTDQTITIDTTGGTVGDIYEVSHDGASGTLTFPGSAATGYTMSFGPGVDGAVIWRGGTTFRSLIPNPTNVPAAIAGSTTVGATLTCSPSIGYHGSFQWQENISSVWTDIAGQTSATYVTTTAGRGYRCNFAGVYYTNVITTAIAAPTFTAQSAPAGTIGSAYSYTFVATGAASYAVASGSIPAGLSFNTGTGVLSGTPTTAATYTFVISATNTGGTTNSTSQSVTVTSATQIVRFTDLTTTGGDVVTETGNGTSGWLYQIPDYANGWVSLAGGASLSLAASADGWVSAKLATITSGPIGHMFGLATTNPKQSYPGFSYNIFAFGTVGSVNYDSTTSPTTNNAIASAAGDNIRFVRAGSTITAQVSRAGTPTTWVDALIWTGASTGHLYPAFNWRGSGAAAGNAITGPITGFGLT